LALLVKRGDPLNRLTIPALPTLASASETNSAAAKGAEKKGTNSLAAKAGTNEAAAKGAGKGGTNSQELVKSGTNAASGQTAGKNGKDGTNATNATNVALVEEPQKAATNAGVSKGKAENTNNSVAI